MIEVYLGDELYQRLFWHGSLPVLPRKEEGLILPSGEPEAAPLKVVVEQVIYDMTSSAGPRIIINVRPWHRDGYTVLERLAKIFQAESEASHD